jgi:putative transposase
VVWLRRESSSALTGSSSTRTGRSASCLPKSVGARRFVYNWGLELSRREYERLDRRPPLRDLKSRLVAIKKGECPWLYEVSAHIGQSALKDLDLAFQRILKGVKGEEETRAKRGFEGRILSATIRRRADRWFVTLCVEREIVQPRPVVRLDDVAGVDLGLRAAAMIHDGLEAKVVYPAQALRKHLGRVARLNRRLARNYRISCLRQDHLHQLTSSLARTKSVIVLEDLQVKAMKQNRHLALSIGDAGMGELRRQLTYKSEWYGARLIVAGRFHPSTQLCSGCVVVNDRVKGFKGLSERTFNCSACGLSLDRDENAALNLRAYGCKELGIVPLPEGLREVTPVGEEGSDLIRSEVKPASLKQEASGSRLNPRHTQRREETLAGAATDGI